MIVQYSSADGLPTSKINGAVQDKTGYLWLATNKGLVRFDGYRFRLFRFNPYQPEGPAFDKVRRLFYDSSRHRLLVCGYGEAFSLLDLHTETFSHFSLPLRKPASNMVSSALFMGEDILIGANYEGIFLLKTGRKELKRLEFKINPQTGQMPSHSYVLKMYPDQRDKNLIWLLDLNGIGQINLASGTYQQWTYSPCLAGLQDYPVSLTDMVPDEAGGFWVSLYGHGITHFNPSGQNCWTVYSYTPPDPKDRQINGVIQIGRKGHRLLLATSDRGVVGFDVPTKKFLPGKYLFESAFTQVDFVYCDYAGSVWFGSREELFVKHSSNTVYREYQLPPSLGNPEQKVTINSILREKGVYYLGGFNMPGILLLDSLRGNRFFAEAPSFSDSNYNPYQLRLSGTNIWHRNRGLQTGIFDITTRAYHLPNHPELRQNNIYAFDILDSFLLTFTLVEGKNRLELRNLTSGKLLHLFQPVKYTRFSHDSRGYFWASADSMRILRIDPRLGKMETLSLAGELSDFAQHTPSFLGEGADGLLWYHLKNGALYVIRNSTKPELAGVIHRLGNQPVSGFDQIDMDAEGNLWLLNEKGLYRYLPLQQDFQSLPLQAGIHLPGKNPGALFSRSPGELIFFTGETLRTFPVKDLFSKGENPSAAIAGIQAGDQSYFSSFPEKFDQDQTQIRFLLRASSLAYPFRLQFRYRVEGDDQWMLTETPEITFNRMAPGRYTLEIQCRLNGENWDQKVTRYSFKIRPYWYQTRVFQILVILMLAGLAGWIYLKRVHRMNRLKMEKLRHEQELMELRMSLFKSQMNPHFLFNTLNGVNYLIVSNKSELASDYLKKFSKLMRLVLSFTNKEWVSLDEELKFLTLYLELESLRFQGKLRYSIEKDPNISGGTAFPAMLIQPLVENAIWHGLMHKREGGNIVIRTEQKDAALVVLVEDDGIGRKKASELKKANSSHERSYGLDLVLQRIRLLNQQGMATFRIEILDLYENDQARGTRVIIEMIP